MLTAPVFNIQHYSIHDGPGIRVTVFLKGCPLRCLWCANPESNSAAPQLMNYRHKCTGCGRCISACPRGAIRLETCDGKLAAVTDRTRCTDCGACAAVCPADARELAGKQMTVEEVLEEVLADRLFLEASGGGMTLSGGECLAHPDFSEALLRAAKEAGLHTAVESCVWAPRETVEQVFRQVDLALLDLKQMDSALHQQYTGVPNERILENIRFIHNNLKVPTALRLPVIPGYNDSEENLTAAARFACETLGGDVELHLLPYHRLGEAKNQALDRASAMGDLQPPSDGQMERLKLLVESFGLKTQIGG